MNYLSKIRDVKETDKSTFIILEIQGHKENELRKYMNTAAIDSELFIDDKRRISAEQREKAWATIDDIASYFGWIDSEMLKDVLMLDFCKENDLQPFSLSRRKNNAASMTVAREFINYILEFAITWEVPLLELAVTRTEDIDKYIYMCLANRICCITGQSGADIHHVTGSRVGMGRNRKKINHSKSELIPLSREWHNKVHNEGEFETFKKYKVYGITLDPFTLKKLKINHEDIS